MGARHHGPTIHHDPRPSLIGTDKWHLLHCGVKKWIHVSVSHAGRGGGTAPGYHIVPLHICVSCVVDCLSLKIFHLILRSATRALQI